MQARELFDQIVTNRGITDVDTFIKADYNSGLHDPLLLPDIKKALKRLVAARDKKETIAIYGDYDIDGLTATTLLRDALTAFGFTVVTYIPDRFAEGYGMSREGVDAVKKCGGQLIITVDCGSRSLDEIAYAATCGIDVIVTDHHEVGATLPTAVAVINAKRRDSKYPFRDLAGCGVAFKLVQAMQTQFTGLPLGAEKWLLDVVALGTVCDVVDLRDENRVLVKWGLEVMKKSRRPGIEALARVSDTDLSSIDTQDLGFRFGPRLNASGRLEHAQFSLNLLTATQDAQAGDIANQLDSMNYTRRSDQATIYKAAREMADLYTNDPVLVLANENWSHGINGIVASKLVEELGKPTFVLQVMGEETKGSARSFGDFHLSDAVAAVDSLIIKGGGHAAAAGVTLVSDKLDDFRRGLNAHYRQLKLGDQSKFLVPDADVEIADFAGLSDELMSLMAQLQPFGNANKAPVFKTKNVAIDSWKPVGADCRHAKMTLRDSTGKKLDGIGFGLVEAIRANDKPSSILFSLEHNEWKGRRSLQAMVLGLVG